MTNQINNQSIIPSTDVIQLTLTLKMITAQVVETSVTVNNNSPIQDNVHQDNQTQPTFEYIFDTQAKNASITGEKYGLMYNWGKDIDGRTIVGGREKLIERWVTETDQTYPLYVGTVPLWITHFYNKYCMRDISRWYNAYKYRNLQPGEWRPMNVDRTLVGLCYYNGTHFNAEIVKLQYDVLNPPNTTQNPISHFHFSSGDIRELVEITLRLYYKLLVKEYVMSHTILMVLAN